ncbi:MAG: D-alanyl-D-alanine carboxypeptidase [Myxococcales bacterium]|nr:D-alanyl-D-alanine carboxypeptidase [Polyangiaceae bacterium]MDW8251939.1 D-alanyl-D-alanine carboxypeptidase [Myxococcales bacterium]
MHRPWVRLLQLFPLLLAVACASASPPAPPLAVAAAFPPPSVSAPTLLSRGSTSPEASSSEPPPAPNFPHGVGVRARLVRSLAALADRAQDRGWTHGVMILDGETGVILFARDEDTLLIPASNTKLFTTLGALDLLGAEHRPEIRFELAGIEGSRAATLIVDGQLCPLGAPFDLGMEKAASSLLKALAERKITRIDRMVVRTPALVAPDRYKELDLTEHSERTAAQLRKALRKARVTVGKLVKESDVKGEPVARYPGPTLAEWITPINQLSHNGLADGLCRYLGLVKGKGASYAEGTSLIREAIEARQIAPPTLADGSGLSRQNRSSVRTIAALLRDAREVAPFVASLSVAGESGTLAGRFKNTPLQGRIRGKTGTLKEVIATSGYLDHPNDGRRYIFALVTNGVEDGKGAEVRQLHDALLGVLGDYWMK